MTTSRFLKLRTFLCFSVAAAALACGSGPDSPGDEDDGDKPGEEIPDPPSDATTLRPLPGRPAEPVCTIEAPETGGAWEVDTGLDEATVLSITATDDALYLFDFRGIRRSVDGGASWQHLKGLPVTSLRSAAGAGDDLFVTGYVSGVGSATFRSKDEGETWSEVAELSGQVIQHLRSQGPAVVADGFFWTPESDVFMAFQNDDFLFLFASDGMTHLGAAYGQTFRSTDGITWDEIVDLNGVVTARLALAGDAAIAVDHVGALYRSANGGVSWSAVGWDATVMGDVSDFVVRQDDILVATTKGLARSIDGGVTFTLAVESSASALDLLFNETPRIAETGDRVVLSASEIYLSTDGGDTWGQAPVLLDATPFALGASRDYLFASTLDGKLHASPGDATWFEIETDGYMMRDFASDKDTHFMLLRAGSPDGIAYFPDGELVSLKDGAGEFEYIERPAQNYMTTFGEVHVHDSVLFLGSESISTGQSGAPGLYGAGLFRSTDHGTSWQAANDGLVSFGKDPQTYQKLYQPVLELHSFGEELFVAMGDGTVMRSSDGGLAWSPAGEGLDTFDPEAPNATDLLGSAAGTLLAASTQASLLFGWDAESASWKSVPGVGLPEHFRLSTLMGYGGVFFAAVRHSSGEIGGVYFSTDGGISWQNAGLGYSIRSLGLKDDALYVGTDGDALWSLGLGPCTTK